VSNFEVFEPILNYSQLNKSILPEKCWTVGKKRPVVFRLIFRRLIPSSSFDKIGMAT